jgi:protein TonB
MFKTKEERLSGDPDRTARAKVIEIPARKRDLLATESSETFSEVEIQLEDKAWDDIVFENRNKEYGAYVIRKGYAGSVITGLIFTSVILLLIIFSPALAKFFSNEKLADEIKPRKLVYTELSAPPPIDKPKPPPPSIQLPKLQKVIKFVPPKVVKETIAEEVPTIEEIKQNEVATVAVEGPVDVAFEEPVEEVVSDGDENEVFLVVEQEPEFSGGYDALMQFIQQNMKYPANARNMGVEGTVYVSFVVGKDGSISEVKVLRGIMRECDQEAIRVVSMMPKWKAGKQNGRNVNVRYTLPLKFRMK